MKATMLVALSMLILAGGSAPAIAESKIAPSLNRDGESALALGDYARAQRAFESAIENAGNRENAGYLRTALAESLLWQGKTSEAAREFKKAQPLVNADSDDQRARLLDDLAWLNQAQNKLESAAANCKQALEIRRAATNENPYLLVSSLTHMGYLSELMGRLDSAASYYHEASQVADKAYGASSLTAADTKEKLAAVDRRLGRCGESNRYFSGALAVKESSNAVVSRFAPHPYWDNVTFRYYDGAPNCERKYIGGKEQMVLTANGVTVAACLVTKPQDVKGSKVDIIVQNQSGQPVEFMTRSPSLIVLAPKPALAPLLDPGKLASKVERRGELKAAWIQFWGANATTPVTTSVIGGERFWGYAPMYAYGSTPPVVTRAGNMTTITQQVPDYAARERALAKADAAISRAHGAADAIRSQTLGPTTIANGRLTQGSLFFDAQNVQKALLRIPVGNAVFEMQFPPE